MLERERSTAEGMQECESGASEHLHAAFGCFGCLSERAALIFVCTESREMESRARS